MKYLYYKKPQVTSIWASMDNMVWWYPGYCTARCRAHGDPVVEIPHYYSPRAPERKREHDPLTHNNNHPGGGGRWSQEHDGSSEYLPVDLSAHRRSDLFGVGRRGGEWRGCRGKPTRRDSCSPSHTTTTTTTNDRSSSYWPALFFPETMWQMD